MYFAVAAHSDSVLSFVSKYSVDPEDGRLSLPTGGGAAAGLELISFFLVSYSYTVRTTAK